MATIRSLLLDAAAQNGEGIALRWKSHGKWQTWTYTEYLKHARTVAEAAAEIGIKPTQRVALMMENRPEWTITYLGLSCSNIEVVPIDAKLQQTEVSHILRDSDSCAIFATGKAWPIIQEIQRTLPHLKHVVMLDNVFAEATTKTGGGITHHDFKLLMDSVEEKAQQPGAAFDLGVPAEEDIASIIYTSGTTGRPKGAMLTHRNFTSQTSAFEYFTVYKHDNFLLVLPLHHAFAFTANFIVPLASQCEISMVENLRTVAENMREVSPSVLLAVPLLAEKMLNGIMVKLNKSPAAKVLMAIGLSKVIGKKVVQGIGGKLRILICGGAASDPEMLKTYAKFGITTLEGYGLTETAPICALSPEKDIRYGTVGKALPNGELRIADPNDEGIGEIQVKGPNLMKGYFRNDAATAEIFEDGWLKTGDLGKMDADGYITITGRKKSLIVNREGKNIYPEEVEMVVNASPYILESLVLGYTNNGEKGERVGIIVVPDMDKIDELRNKGSSLTDDQIIDLCKKEVQRMVKQIADYKHPRQIMVRFEPLEKTTTQKIKRYLYNLSGSKN